MSKVKQHLITSEISVRCLKNLVSVLIKGMAFHSKYPDRSLVKYTKEQAKIKVIYKLPANYWGDIIWDPVKQAATRGKKAMAYISLS